MIDILLKLIFLNQKFQEKGYETCGDRNFTELKSNLIHRFGQRVRYVWRNKELTPKGEDVKLITQWKHVPHRIG